ncbi:MAG: cysteine desulfurase family protein [Nitratireductor sp.]
MSGNQRIYLDYNATAPLLPQARAAMIDALDRVGNASSVHAEGRNARKLVEHARSKLASLLDCEARQVTFTSGATEAAHHVLSPHLRASGHDIHVSQLYVGATEHPCVLAGGCFNAGRITVLPVDGNGMIDLEGLDRTLAAHDRTKGAAMIAVQLANNETGAIQPLYRISAIVHGHNAFLVVDAVQGLGKMPLTLAATGADFAFFSAHKIGGPQGVGALVAANAGVMPLPLLRGGGQENFQRAGTENVAAIAGFAAALENLPSQADLVRIGIIRDSIEAQLRTISLEAGNKVGEPVVFAKGAERLVNTSCFSLPGIRAETALIALDLAGFALSSGSACSSGKVRKSHVLDAMGIEDNLARSALRLSIGRQTSELHAGQFLSAWKEMVKRLA